MTRELTIWTITFGAVTCVTVAAWLAAKGEEYRERRRANQPELR